MKGSDMTDKILNNLLEKYEAVSNIKCNNKSLSTIKSHIMHHYIERAMNLPKRDLPESILSISERCQWCLNKWTEGQFSAQLKPEKYPKSSLCKLFRKDESKLNKFRLKLVLKYKKRWKSNALKLMCSTCRKETTIYIEKPSSIKREAQKQEKIQRKKMKKARNSNYQTGEKLKENSKKKFKKNKKKDMYAGLNKSVFTGPLNKKKAHNSYSEGTNRPTYQDNKKQTNVYKHLNKISKGSYSSDVGKKNTLVQNLLSLH